MKITVVEPSCCGGGVLLGHVEYALHITGIKAEIETVGEMQEMMKFNIVLPPALLIDGMVVLEGRSVTSEAVRKEIEFAGGK